MKTASASGARLIVTALVVSALAATAPRCALDPTVTVYPIYLTPSSERPFTNLVDMVEARDYHAATSRRWTVEQKQKPTPRELAALGHLEMVSGRSDRARVHLTRALDGVPSRDMIASIYWDLSQAEFLAGHYGASATAARNAVRNGLQVSQWHLDLLDTLDGVEIETTFSGSSGELALVVRDAHIPHVPSSVNGRKNVSAIIDSGAVFTIMSRSLADEAGIDVLGRSGKLLGLLNEPIAVEFGIMRSLKIGDLRVHDLLVAIMADEDLRFFVQGDRPYQMDLLLGSNLLRHLKINLDFRNQIVKLEPSAGSAVSSEQNLFLVGFRPMVQVSINRRGWFPFLLDTGSEVTYLNQSLLEATSVRGRHQVHGATLQGIGGSKKRGSQLLDVELATTGWGGSFRTLPTYASPGSPAFGILGQNFLSQFHVVIDFGRMRFDLLR